MSVPDLEDPDQRAAYAAELGGEARSQRAIGLVLVALGAAMLLAAEFWVPLDSRDLALATAVVTLLVGWGLLAHAVLRRTRYHKARLRE